MNTENHKKIEETPDEHKATEIKETESVTQHSILLNGEKINYTVTTGTIVLKEEDFEQGEKQKASIFYVAYTKNGESISRPVTFSFNGGPGSSSVWLHLGLLGPKRVLMDEEGQPIGPPHQLVDNEYSLLDQTDLVFIDPVSTGYSRTVPKEKPDQFHEVKKDIESVGEFIRIWTTRNKRWTSPKFLIGESYGTTRAAGLAGYLHQRHGMYLNGIMFISSILNFLTASFDEGNDLPYILFLPSYTATAWYHKKLQEDLQDDFDSLSEILKPETVFFHDIKYDDEEHYYLIKDTINKRSINARFCEVLKFKKDLTLDEFEKIMFGSSINRANV